MQHSEIAEECTSGLMGEDNAGDPMELVLGPGRYHIDIQPSVDFGSVGQEGAVVAKWSDLSKAFCISPADNNDLHRNNPGGGFGMPASLPLAPALARAGRA